MFCTFDSFIILVKTPLVFIATTYEAGLDKKLIWEHRITEITKHVFLPVALKIVLIFK